MTTKTLGMGKAAIGPSAWRNNTLQEIKRSQTAVRISDKACQVGKAVDPVPHLRDVVADLSNYEAHRYFRGTRTIVALLRDSLMNTNEEIKSLTRGKEALEKALDHNRKDMWLNRQCQENRRSRPSRERKPDGADDLLHAERIHLCGLKRMLETQLQLVQNHLKVLDGSRARLQAVLEERSAVLDLVCHAIPASGRSAVPLHRTGIPSTCRSRMCISADVLRSQLSRPVVDPLGPYTPETDLALQEAKEARSRAIMLRKDVTDILKKAEKLKEATHKSVNNGLIHKVSETVGLKQHLEVAAGENRHATNRAQRWHNNTEQAWEYCRGPVSSSDLSSREKLNRPIIRVLQKHPGTNMPEAQEIVKGSDGLLEALQTTQQNIGMLKMAQLKLKDDIQDKKSAIDIDASIIRMRRRKADHRWVMGETY